MNTHPSFFLLAMFFNNSSVNVHIMEAKKSTHIENFVSTEIVQIMVTYAGQACFMFDTNGYLPAHHFACNHNCSPEQLDILLQINPDAISAVTNDGYDVLSLAKKTATKSHSNCSLIRYIIEKSEKVTNSLISV